MCYSHVQNQKNRKNSMKYSVTETRGAEEVHKSIFFEIKHLITFISSLQIIVINSKELNQLDDNSSLASPPRNPPIKNVVSKRNLTQPNKNKSTQILLLLIFAIKHKVERRMVHNLRR